MGNYLQFRTSDGDWVCGVESDKIAKRGEIIIENARSIEMMAMEEPGKYGVMFLPYTPTDPHIETVFHKHHIISEVCGGDSVLAAEYITHIKGCEARNNELEVAPARILQLVPTKTNKEITDDPV